MNIRITPIIPALLVAAIGFAAPTLTSSSRRMYTPDPHSLDIVEDDDGIPRIEVRGFTTPTDVGYNLADLLTNDTVDVSNLKVLIRDETSDADNREMKYARIAKIVGHSGASLPPDEQSVTTKKSNGAVADGTLSLYGYENASGSYIPYRSYSGYLEWCRIDGDYRTIMFDGMSPGSSSQKFSLLGSENSDNYNHYALLDSSGTLRWENPTDGKSTELDTQYKVQLKGIDVNPDSLPYSGHNSSLGWLPFSGSASEDQYLACDGSSLKWVNNPQKGEPGEPGAPGRPGKDGDPNQEKFYEWIENWVTNVGYQVMQDHFVTSVNGEKGDVVLKTLYFKIGGSTIMAEYNGSADVDVPYINESTTAPGNAMAADTALYADAAGEASHATDAVTAHQALYATNSGSADHADHADYAEEAGRIRSTTLMNAAPKSSASLGNLKFSANGTVLTITDGTNTWTLSADI